MAMEIELQLDVWSYTLIAVILSLLILPVCLSKDPDYHPLALQHQSHPSNVRQPKESAVYRSQETSHGLPLKTGLSLPGEKSWQFRDGDLRDIWNLYVEKGKGIVQSVKGFEVTNVEVAKITRWIHIIGSHLSSAGAKRIALYLPNDIENLVVSFACAFYDLTLVVIPYPSDPKTIQTVISKTHSEYLVSAAGILTLNDVQGIQCLKNILYVVEEASRKLDWNTPPGSRIQARTFHDLIEGDAKPEQPAPKEVDVDGPAIIVPYVPLTTNKIEFTEFTQRNIVAAVGSQLISLPTAERLSPSDIFLPVDSLSALFPRIMTYTALCSGTLLALNSVAGPQAHLEHACRPVSPTVIIANPHTLLATIRNTAGTQMEMWHWLIHWFQKRTLASGRIPKGNWLTRLNDYQRPVLGKPQRLRLCFTYELAITDTQPLNSPDLCDLRIYFSAKVIYALCSPKVAGAICQQNVYDYRYEKPERMPSRKYKIPRNCTHFGPPTPAVEVWLRDYDTYKVTDKPCPRGQIWVRGPTVAGPHGREKGVGIGVVGKWRPDGCLEFV
ncbi:hypothetical protein BDZ91DRAFT_798724 [Kalaharituber pfeilii]|nr:hypothetical protein BDZ91DRAFT_798724 [Kalaharituber pfeilii]